MGFGPPAHRCTILDLGEELKEWVIGKINLTKHKRNEKFGSDPFGRRRIYIIPLFHHSLAQTWHTITEVYKLYTQKYYSGITIPLKRRARAGHYSMCEASLSSLSKYL